jgi:flagellar motor component MotA
MEDSFMKNAFQLAVDNTNPETIWKILQDKIIFGDYRGKELLHRMIIVEGTVMILNGYPPRFI